MSPNAHSGELGLGNRGRTDLLHVQRQIHHFASAGRHWGVSLVIIGVVHAVSVVLAFGLTYIVITSQSDPYVSQTCWPRIQTL